MTGELWRSYTATDTLLSKPIGATIEAILTAYLNERLINHGTIKSARTYAKIAIEHMGTATLAELAKEPAILVRYFRASPFPPRWAPKTKYNYRLLIRAAISYWIKSRGMDCPNPMNVVFLDPQTAIRENVPTPEQYQALLDAAANIGAPPYIRWLITAAWETGLRVSEYLGWQWEDIDMSFRSGLPWYSVYIRKQRRMVKRQIPMSQGLWEMLSEIPRRKSGPVWPVENPPYRILKRVFREANMPGLHLHDFRKSYKTFRKAEGWPKEITKAVQGHATDSMDSYYTVFGREHLSRFVTQMWDQSVLRQNNLLIPLAKSQRTA